MAEHQILRVGFIGAGKRAQKAHYPNVSKLEGLSLEAVAEMDEARMKEVAKTYKIPKTFLCKTEEDFKEMLESVEIDIMYVIMDEHHMTAPAVACMEAGKHVFIEKPAGANSEESCQLLETAVTNGVYCLVGYQRRYAALTREAMRAVKERGPATFAMGEFHKPGDFKDDETHEVWRDTSHVIDLVRYMADSDAVEVTAYQDGYPTGQKNMFNALIRFANCSVGFVTASRMAGGRKLRAELHGLGVDCYFYPPKNLEIHRKGKTPEHLTGAKLADLPDDDVDGYEGVRAMHQHFIDCIRRGVVPSSDIRDVIHTSRLVDRITGKVNG